MLARLGTRPQRFVGLCSIVCAGLLTSLPATADKPGNEVGQASASVPTLSGSGRFHAPADVQEPPRDALQTASGIAMIVLQSGSGSQHPGGDDCVVVKFTAWRRDGTLQATSGVHRETALQCLTSMIPGASEAPQLMVPGEKRRIWIPAELAFSAHAMHHHDKDLRQYPQPMFDLTLDLELVRILTAPRRHSNLNNPPETAQKMPSGLAIQILKPGTGTHPTMTSRVTLDYTGWNAEGTLFESTIMSGHAAVVLIGSALPGWREALPLMVTGEKARIWVPAALAYGDATSQQATSPAGNLVYEIELLGIE